MLSATDLKSAMLDALRNSSDESFGMVWIKSCSIGPEQLAGSAVQAI
jgi:hypothetical protein